MIGRACVAGALAMSVCALQAAAQGVGPDVIVGDLPDTAFYTSSGAIGGMHAWAVGTVSCNIGTQPLQWISSTNRHPVISQNLYRLQGGRFEQIGQAFLKHGFTALQGNVCGTCSPYPNGSALGVGCSDPYSASLNGGQSGLGPKFEVNAATGYFPYPFTNLPYSGALGRRLQARQTDLALPGALYFVASMYIAPDDIEAGNGNNNQSYRRVAFNANYSMSLQGTTQRSKPAIHAWRDHGLGQDTPDPSVTLVNADVPGDGRFILGCRVSDNGNGTWRYEYAVQNFRSDRSGQSFTVPLPAGVSVTNVGFHDVDYHSGEPFSLTDWTATVGGSGITWSTQTYSQNVNANALRWDTIYNFRFDADAAPGAGSVTLGLFKPGTPTEIQIAATIPAGGDPPAPVNDICANALSVSAGATGFSNAYATTEGAGEPGCLANGTDQFNRDLWYRFVAPAGCDGTLTIDTCGSGFDTRLAVYSACPGSGGLIACNDDAAACGAGSTASSVSFSATGGAVYLIRVGGTAEASGAGVLNITPPVCVPTGPANDACANAITLSDGIAVEGTSIGATNDGSATCGSSGSSPDVWYSYTPATSAQVTISTCGTASFDTVLSIHAACGGSQVACLDDTSGCAGYTTRLVASLTGGVRYLIRVAGYNGAAGTFTISASGGGSGGGPVPPANDDCANRAGVGLGATPFTTVNATTDGPSHALCLSNGQSLVANDVWFNHPATVTGNLVVSTCGSGYDTFVAVYDGYGCADFEARLMACNDDFQCIGGTTQSQVVVPVVAGTSYTIRIGGYNGATGAGTLNLSMQPVSGERYAVSFVAATTVPGLGTVQNEDVVVFDTGTGAWSMLFDGSDVGLGSLTIDGFAVTPGGDFLLSFAEATSIAGMTGSPSRTTLDDSDIVRFIPSSTGPDTAGSFVFHFDGSDVGLTQNNEDVDAIAIAPDGRLIISLLGSGSVTGVSSAQDEDLLIFTASSLGSVTAGSFALYFDGSDVGLATNSGENIDAAALTSNGDILFSTVGAFSVTGLTGADEDVGRFAPVSLGSTTSGSFEMALDLSSLGIATSANIGALDLLVPAPLPSHKPPATALGGRCEADFDCDGAVTVGDVFVYLTEFFAGAKAADIDDSGLVETADLIAYLSVYFAGCAEP